MSEQQLPLQKPLTGSQRLTWWPVWEMVKEGVPLQLRVEWEMDQQYLKLM